MDEPSEQLLSLLERLRLATVGQVRSHRAQVRRLVGDLASFDSVWVDALAQNGLLTPFQAREINAGRSAGLQVGPFVLQRPQGTLGYCDCYTARHIESAAVVRLYVTAMLHVTRDVAQRQLEELRQRSASVPRNHLLPIQASGACGDRLWAATPPAEARSAADWMVENGRFPADAVLPIAQTMASALATLSEQSIVHGDISAASLLVEHGRVLLGHPGLRGIVRPSEGYAYHDLSPAAYDYLAPERIASGVPPTVATDLYACGALWWHLLSGRPPFAGGNSLAKLQHVHAARLTDVRRLAPEAPRELTQAITRCLAPDPNDRPSDFRQLAGMLGTAPRRAAQRLERLFDRRDRSRVLLGRQSIEQGSGNRVLRRSVTTACVLALIALAAWPAWRRSELVSRWFPGPSRSAIASTAIAANGTDRSAKLDRAQPAAQAPAKTRSQPEGRATPVAYWTEDQVPPLVLPTGRVLTLERLSLRPGQVVRGELGLRPKVVVPSRGLSIAVEDVTIENIDFVAASPDASAGTPGMIVVSAARAQFQGCTFRGSGAADAQRPAIVWRGPARWRRTGGEGSGQLSLRNCVVAQLGCAVEVAGAPRFSLALANSLFADCGTVVRLRRGANFDPSGDLLLEHVTTRETGPVILVERGAASADGGLLTVTAMESTLAPRLGTPLMVVASEKPLAAPLDWIEWQGQGSLLAGDAPMAGWQTPEGHLEPIADEQLSVAGLVRSSVQFAGKSVGDASASRTLRWQVPLQSDAPPGIGGDLP